MSLVSTNDEFNSGWGTLAGRQSPETRLPEHHRPYCLAADSGHMPKPGSCLQRDTPAELAGSPKPGAIPESRFARTK